MDKTKCAVLLLLAGLLCIGCNGSDRPDEAAVPANSVDTQTSLALPAGFPEDVALPEPVLISEQNELWNRLFTLTVTSELSETALVEDLHTRMTAAGWALTDTVKFEYPKTVITFAKDDRATSYVVKSQGGKSEVMLTTGPAAKGRLVIQVN